MFPTDPIFAAAPILLLIYWMTKKTPMPSARALPLAAVVAYGIRLVWFGTDANLVNASVVAGLLVALTPVLIVWGAIFFFLTMEHCGAMETIRRWLNQLSRNRVAQVVIIGWSFQFLIEGASGFGTPAALAGPLLVGLGFPQLADAAAKAEIEKLTAGCADKPQFFVDKLAQGVAMIAAAFYPKDVILRLSDFKTNEYANLIGGRAYEPAEENPMIGFRGASRYYHPRYQAGFALECRAMKKVRDEMGLTNLKLMIPFCRTLEEGRRVQADLAQHGLKRGENSLELYVMCEIPSNVILADEFCDLFDGFSIGSNDLTQLILGVDRDSEIVAPIFDERNAAVKEMIAQVIAVCRKRGRKIGICGQAPSDYPEFAQFLVEQGIDSISLNPDTVLKTTLAILEQERHGRC